MPIEFPTIPDRWYRVLVGIMVAMLLLTIVKMSDEYHYRANAQKNEHALEMAKKGYCLRATPGSPELTYQPCSIQKEY